MLLEQNKKAKEGEKNLVSQNLVHICVCTFTPGSSLASSARETLETFLLSSIETSDIHVCGCSTKHQHCAPTYIYAMWFERCEEASLLVRHQHQPITVILPLAYSSLVSEAHLTLQYLPGHLYEIFVPHPRTDASTTGPTTFSKCAESRNFV